MLKVMKSPYFGHEIDSAARIIYWSINGATGYRCYSILRGIGMIKVTWNICFTGKVVCLLCKRQEHIYSRLLTANTQLYR